MTTILAKTMSAMLVISVLAISGCGSDPQAFDAKTAYDMDALKEELVFRYQGMIAKAKTAKAKTAVPKKSYDAPEQREQGVEEAKAAPDETPADLVREILAKAAKVPGQTADTSKSELGSFVKSTDKIPDEQKAPLLEALESR